MKVIVSDVINDIIGVIDDENKKVNCGLTSLRFKTGKVVKCPSSQDAEGRLLETLPTPSTPTTPLVAKKEQSDLATEV